MRTWFACLFFLTIGMLPFGYRIEPLQVTEVRHGLVTLQGDDSVFQVDEEEAWRPGDRAEAIVRDGIRMEEVNNEKNIL